ncbi:MAG: thioredoxin family protein [Actinomycetes bacterium]
MNESHQRRAAREVAAGREVEPMIVELFGSGCEKCQAMEVSLRLALDELGMGDSATLYRIEDPASMVGRGVWRAPGLALDGKVVVRGRAPEPNELKKLIVAATERAGG